MFANEFVLNIGMFLDSTGSTNEAMDAMHKIGVSSNFLYIFNVDDFHSIKEKRRPDTIWLSTAHHMATLVCKQVISCPQIPINYNGASIHNPVIVDAYNINYRLIHKHYGTFDKSYTERKFQWIRQKTEFTDFDRIELLTVHSYDNSIVEKKDERSMKNVRLIDMKEQQLHSMQDYIDALKIILESGDNNTHLNGYIAPVVADWPGQLFIRKAIVHLRAQE
ncbi:unnamed protein product [Rhizophagus irregularis]|nr:unnamed protein product [Rhizophagus irregularis]